MAIQRILCATDFSASASHALDYAADLCARLRATLVILHVYQPPPGTHRTATNHRDAAATEKIEDLYRQQLEDLVAPLRASVDSLSCELAEGPAWERILNHAKQSDADLIVIGRNGRAGLSQLFVGSTATRVVKNAAVPVLTVRA